MIDKIKNWWKENKSFIGILLVMVLTVFLLADLNITNRNMDTEDCTLKCEELGYEYFDSTPSKFFGLKERDCKCKIDNEIKDIL